MAIGKHFLDQYSVICVFGSVVGCVVFPLITQSVESLILSAIVISLTAKTLSRKMLTPTAEPSNGKDDRRRGKERDRDKERDRNRDFEKDSPRQDKKQQSKKKRQSGSPVSTNSDDLPQWEDDQKKYEEEASAEKERRLEERREKKAKKKQERLKRKEEERKEKEREEVRRKEKQLTRAQKKQELETKMTQQLGYTPIKHLSQISDLPRNSIHERHGSTGSSTGSSVRSKTKQSRQPIRASSDTILLGNESPLLTPPTSHPPSPSSSTSSKTSPWKPLPSVNIPPRWQPDDLFQQQRRVERPAPVRQSIHPPRHASASVHHVVTSPTYSNGSISLAGFTTNTQSVVSSNTGGLLSSELTKSQSCESLNQPSTRQCWVPGPASAPTNLRQIMKEEQTAVMFQQGTSGPLYSLFSGEQSPFSPSLLGSGTGSASSPRDTWPEL